MRRVEVYIEGGGTTSSQRAGLRAGFSEFIGSQREEARQNGIEIRLICCGGRAETYRRFVDALGQGEDCVYLLLVDSEAPVPIGTSPWRHLEQSPGDKWSQPEGIGDEDCHLMVACMETWLLAGGDQLSRYYGRNFSSKSIPAAQGLEGQPKETIIRSFVAATRKTSKGEYDKGCHSAALLTIVDPIQVRRNCRWCERFLHRLESLARMK